MISQPTLPSLFSELGVFMVWVTLRGNSFIQQTHFPLTWFFQLFKLFEGELFEATSLNLLLITWHFQLIFVWYEKHVISFSKFHHKELTVFLSFCPFILSSTMCLSSSCFVPGAVLSLSGEAALDPPAHKRSTIVMSMKKVQGC